MRKKKPKVKTRHIVEEINGVKYGVKITPSNMFKVESCSLSPLKTLIEPLVSKEVRLSNKTDVGSKLHENNKPCLIMFRGDTANPYSKSKYKNNQALYLDTTPHSFIKKYFKGLHINSKPTIRTTINYEDKDYKTYCSLSILNSHNCEIGYVSYTVCSNGYCASPRIYLKRISYIYLLNQ